MLLVRIFIESIGGPFVMNLEFIYILLIYSQSISIVEVRRSRYFLQNYYLRSSQLKTQIYNIACLFGYS